MDAGCKADMLPVLVGPQGCGKSTVVQAIAPGPDFFMEFNFTDKSDDNARRMRGRLVVECAELQGLGGRDSEMVKATITRTHEDWVPKFKEFSNSYPRRSIFWGSSNSRNFLTDATGNRRWLPVEVTHGFPHRVTRDREQLWAEAKELYGMLGIAHEDAERLAVNVHEDFSEIDSTEEALVEFFANQQKKNADGVPFGQAEYMLSTDLWFNAFGYADGRAPKKDERRVARAMSRLGWEKRQRLITRGEKKKWVWVNLNKSS
jgi:predicted P-loop ATPase